MGRRNRKRSRSIEQQAADAAEAVVNAQAGVRHRKAQIAEAQQELSALDGVAGWIPALLGKKAAYIAELQDKIAKSKASMLELRKKLIDAQTEQRRLSGKLEDAKRASLSRDEELENFAERIRTGTHPIAETLAEQEARLDALSGELEKCHEAALACVNLRASIAELLYRAGRSKTAVLFNQFGWDTAIDINSTRKARERLEKVPDAVQHFNDTCEVLGLPPIDLQFPDIEYGWKFLMIDDSMDTWRTRQVLTLCDSLEQVRDIVQETTLWVVSKRTEFEQSYEAVVKERRAMLDAALR